MASHITYDGVTGAAAGGNIFRNIKFWVSRRVPQRDSILDKIQSNSGVVVAREKDADMLIADHARKDAPLGSYSWKYITESVNAGIIQVEDKYLIGPPPNQHRSVLTGAHVKTTRTKFTEQDDAIVAKWILKNGINTAGNKMYMELEDAYPHHPWQSWRNRWVKVLSARSNAEIDRLARLANVDVDNAPVTARHIIRKHQREDWPQAPQNNAVPNANRNPQNHNVPAPRIPRSEQPRPRDVASSDRNRRNVTDDAPSRQNSERNEEEDTAIHNDTAGGARSATVREAERESKQENKQKESARMEPEGELREEEERNAEQDTENDDSQALSSFSEREQFLNDLQDYCEANGKALDTRCVIGKKEVDLWELFRAVSAQELPPDELDWRQVAENVGLGLVRNGEAVAALLRSSYNCHLADFVEAMMSFEENEEDPDEEIAEGEETLIGEGETEAESRTPRASQKNGAASPLSNDTGGIELRKRLPDGQLSTPTKLAKRRRTVHAEIPVTPEDKLKTGRPPSAPVSAPGNLQSTADQEQELPEVVEDSQQRTPRHNQQHQRSPDEPDMTPSQQLRSESDSIASPEQGESRTPTLYYSPTASFPHRNSQLETIQEEDSTTSTPTKSRPKRRELPASFQVPREPRLMQLEERREKRRQLEQERRLRQQQRQQQRLEEHRQQELRQEERRREEEQQQQQQQQEEQQGDEAQEQELQRQRWHQDAADSSDTDPEVVQQSQEQFISWKQHYRDQGFSEDIIIEAMRRTTMTPGEAMEAVLASLRDGQGIPPNHEGIWTDRDDAQLKYVVRVGDLRRAPDDDGDARRRKEKAREMLDRLLFKHDEPRVKLRRKFHRAVALAERDRRRRDRLSREGNGQ
ncbi:transcriptional regulator family: ARID/BRIGHT [Trichoderma aggressivum f. europaeum]|uniref:DNA-binding protein RAP1 n=1 Tax=Trichoderma aggressivum f. europaeum TaxID=173218 RepID=A0AAE1I8Z2_9HYPO|nr:transcriptional regulator family: ARID/BRIGHT [Trichoderma aggressivum f. europaeum]